MSKLVTAKQLAAILGCSREYAALCCRGAIKHRISAHAFRYDLEKAKELYAHRLERGMAENLDDGRGLPGRKMTQAEMVRWNEDHPFVREAVWRFVRRFGELVAPKHNFMNGAVVNGKHADW